MMFGTIALFNQQESIPCMLVHHTLESRLELTQVRTTLGLYTKGVEPWVITLRIVWGRGLIFFVSY